MITVINTDLFSVLSFKLKQIRRSLNKFKPLIKRIKSLSGRSLGKIVSPRRGHFSRRLYRFIDYKRIVFSGDYGLVLRPSYNPGTSANIGFVCFPLGVFLNILLPAKISSGDIVQNYTQNPRNNGDSSTLKNIPSGSLIHNISLSVRGMGILSRSAGCFTILVRKENNHALMKLKSGEYRYFSTSVTASLGTVGNEDHFLRSYRKAGTIRLLGKRPRPRPSAMNPVDHPMGGRTKGGCQPMNSKGHEPLNKSTKTFYHPMILYTKRQMKFRKQ